jgi:23S rRNA (cytidine1920-2'-O)/16S rRNA (cytidine1409-2'-O)-methyltransferase
LFALSVNWKVKKVHKNRTTGTQETGKGVRLDVLAVERGLAETREQAQRLILAGQLVAPQGQLLKPGMKVAPDFELHLLAPQKYVSRGGLKLEAALAHFALSVRDCVCVDVGASTGGFTDCLLQHGARLVYAVDVGSSTLHARLRQDRRVRIFDHTNARFLTRGCFDEPPTFAAVDVSFISVTKVLPALAEAAAEDAVGVVLAKPQFEATVAEVSRGHGVLRDPRVHERVLAGLIDAIAATGWWVCGAIPSPILGGSGNREYLVHVSRQPGPAAAVEVEALVREAFLIA